MIRAPGASRWGLSPKDAIKLERVESKSAITPKRPVGRKEIRLKKGDVVRYLLANSEWEGSAPSESVRRSTDPICYILSFIT